MAILLGRHSFMATLFSRAILIALKGLSISSIVTEPTFLELLPLLSNFAVEASCGLDLWSFSKSSSGLLLPWLFLFLRLRLLLLDDFFLSSFCLLFLAWALVTTCKVATYSLLDAGGDGITSTRFKVTLGGFSAFAAGLLGQFLPRWSIWHPR